MNTDSIQARKVVEIQKVGDFCFDENYSTIYVWLPGTSGPDALAIQKGVADGPQIWGWDGNMETPTLTPSIYAINKWHGYLQNGFLKSG